MNLDAEIELSAVIVKPLLQWYRKNKRSLPWRDDPTPYSVWISEVMLQQTRAETVKSYFIRFMQEVPDVKALSEIQDDKLMKLWEGLGYYSRAKNLRAAAKKIITEYQGELPCKKEQLMELPGVGAYTAGAIASIAYGEPTPAVDGNVLRVISRLTAYGEEIQSERAKRLVEKALKAIYPRQESGDFTQSLMELGAIVCLPREKPDCANCPIAFDCLAFQRNAVDEYPVKKQKRQRKSEEYTVFLLKCGDKIAIRKRPEKGVLAGLWELPNRKGHLSLKEAEEFLIREGLAISDIKKDHQAKHIFTHIEWEMLAYRIWCNTENAQYIWVDQKDMQENVALPSAFRYWDFFKNNAE